MRFEAFALGLALVVHAGPSRAGPQDPAAQCEAAAVQASEESGVPLRILQAIDVVESGRKSAGRLRPWPWTVNLHGEGHWFSTQHEARDFLKGAQGEGARSFDVGCFQLNHRWHGAAFPSAEAMFDPLENARYAARFLARLRAREGDWGAAVAAYHSATPDKAEAYRARFDTAYAALAQTPAAPAPALRDNRFPLLHGRGSGASLVPLPTTARRLIGE
jgi:hypothetical protein